MKNKEIEIEISINPSTETDDYKWGELSEKLFRPLKPEDLPSHYYVLTLDKKTGKTIVKAHKAVYDF